MNKVVFIFLLSLVLCKYNPEKARILVEEINNKKTTWKATLYDRDYSSLIGSLQAGKKSSLPLKTEFRSSNGDLPENYDLRKEYPNCETILEIRDQSSCGACWAFATTETASDRLCIHSRGKIQTRVSAQYLTSCCESCGSGCEGGYPNEGFKYWIENGIPSGGLYGDKNTCCPYQIKPKNHFLSYLKGKNDTPECPKSCIPEYPKTIEEDKSYGLRAYTLSEEENIMREIYENGSVASSFFVFTDFYQYKSGIYKHEGGDFSGGHSIKIIGWGVEDGVKYWIVANSWGKDWGENGFFRILRGTNECMIEASVETALPKL